MIAYIKKEIKKLFPYDRLMERKWLNSNPYHGTDAEWSKEFIKANPVIGILYDVAQEHQYYMNACHNLKINYVVIDIRSTDWLLKIEQSGCETMLVWPTIYKPIQKQFWDERLQILSTHLNKRIFPTYDLLWLYESKRKTRDWLLANRLPHPKTDIFFDKSEAENFLQSAKFPIICKTDQGAASSGVYILRSRQQALQTLSKAFKKGLSLKNRGIYDRHQGYIIFQEYLPNCKEWRIIRVGDSYFCRYKMKKGDFHSGSGDIVWAKPPEYLLNLTREISNKFDVPNINVDYFETEEGSYLINEIHALWGGKVLKDEQLEGRYLYNEQTQGWDFEHGDFFKNRCADLRLEWLIKNKWV